MMLTAGTEDTTCLATYRLAAAFPFLVVSTSIVNPAFQAARTSAIDK